MLYPLLPFNSFPIPELIKSFGLKIREMNIVMLVLILSLLVISAECKKGSFKAAEEARWLVAQGNWGTMSYKKPDEPTAPLSTVVSFADAKGGIFFYLMGPQSLDACLTLSEAELKPFTNFAGAACGTDGSADPEDPRCAKLSLTGKVAPCESEESCALGKAALFEQHPEMKEWPTSHNFVVHEFMITDLWMIYSYGGGSTISPEDFISAQPKHHPGGKTIEESEELSDMKIKTEDVVKKDPVPHWDKKVERARWIVSKSVWTTVSTISVRLDGSPWGNIRSLVDGASLESSTGKPIFYLPSPDPTSIDVAQNHNISLQFSEASLAERLDDDGNTCGGKDAMDPLCGQLMISGIAKKVTCPEMLKTAQEAFKERHPLAPWLAKGGAHTGGNYFTIEPEKITLLDYYGGATEIDVKDYLDWEKPSSSMMAIAKRMLRGTI